MELDLRQCLMARSTDLSLEIEKRLCAKSLGEFMRMGWEQLHPATPFIGGWALDAMCEHLEAVSSGEIKNLLINVPPGCTKSMLVNIYWPAWEWGPLNRPSTQFISASYERGLSVQHMVRCREIMQGEWYQTRWGKNFDFKGDANMKTAYHNTFQGTRFASSVGASIVGYRGDRLIIDDPHDVHKVESDTIREDVIRWFAETLPTRKNNKDTATIVIMQRVHERDVSGFILAKELGYTHLCLPMTYDADHPYPSTHFVDPREPGELLWPERFDEETVAELRASFRAFGGSYAEAGQLEQRPSPRGGGMFQQKDFQFLDAPPRPDEIDKGCRGWDLAATEGGGSFTAGVKMARLKDGSIVILDAVRGQWRPSEVYDRIRTCAIQDGHGFVQSIPQDPGQAGKDQKRHIAAHMHGCTLHFSPESGSKVDRARPLASQAEAGNLYLVRGAWNDTFIQNACVFPRGEFLDDIDAASRAYGRLIQSRVPLLGASPRLIGG